MNEQSEANTIFALVLECPESIMDALEQWLKNKATIRFAKRTNRSKWIWVKIVSKSSRFEGMKGGKKNENGNNWLSNP